MFKIAITVISVLTFSSAFASVPGAQSLRCHTPDSDTVRVFADIWMTGHPMGGVTNFGGIMQVDGHTFRVNTSLEPVAFYGSSGDLSWVDFELVLGDLFQAPLNADRRSDLRQRSQAHDFSPAGPWTSEAMICRWIK